MKRTTALTAAGALVLTVAGGISTLAVIGRPAVVELPVIIHYVDEVGNTVPAPVVAPTAEPQPAATEPSTLEPDVPTTPSEESYQLTVESYQEDEHETEAAHSHDEENEAEGHEKAGDDNS